MLSYKFPIFEKGRVLKLEMLEALRDYPFDLIQTRYADYSDGIISGLNVSSENELVNISRGLVKFDGRIYILVNDFSIHCENLGVDLVLKIRFEDYDENEKDFNDFYTDIIFDTEFELQENDIEICRFDLREGAKLRYNYIDMYDMTTRYDTVNIIHAPFSAYGESTVSPKLTRYFAKEVFNTTAFDHIDMSFCSLCLNNDIPIDKLLIMGYIKQKLDIDEKEVFTNIKIFNYLCKILDNIKNDKNNIRKSKGINKKKIIVD